MNLSTFWKRVSNLGDWKLRLAVGGFLLVILVEGLSSMAQESATVDEVAHLPEGYTYWKTGEFRPGRENPSLPKLLGAVPLLFMDVKTPSSLSDWPRVNPYDYGKDFLYRFPQNGDRALFWGRVPMLLLSLLLAVFVFKWARDLYGRMAGLFAVFLYAFEPNILAHSRYVTPDLAVTAFMFLATYWYWRFLRSFSYRDLFLVGLTTGLSLTSKFSALILFPLLIILGISYLASTKKAPSSAFGSARLTFTEPGRWKGLVFSWLVIFLIAFVVIFAVYGFQSRLVVESGVEHQKLNQLIPGGNHYLKGVVYFMAENIPIPAADWWQGLYAQMKHLREGHPAFLMGRYSDSGWWYYYLVAFFIKTPIPLILLLLLGITMVLKDVKNYSDWFDELFLVLPTILILSTGLFSRIAIGLRYILPLYPFIIVFASRAVKAEFAKRALLPMVVGVLSLWYLVSSLLIYPHYLAYFNEFIGGPRNGYKYLVDSNLDWGQDLKRLKIYQDEKKLDRIKLSYFGNADPVYYRLLFQSITQQEMFRPAPGTYAVSATELQNVYQESKKRFSWLKKLKPLDTVGYSIFIYRIRR